MTFAEYLTERDIAESTRKLYLRIAARIPEGVDPEAWLLDQVTEATPKGTRASLRGTVIALVRWRSGDPEAKLQVKLPRMRRGVVYGRDALSEEDAKLYDAMLDEGACTEPARTILRLLAHTGLRISELCSLTWKAVDLRGRGGRPGVDVVGKGNKTRWVPLTKTARKILTEYKQGLDEDLGTFVFPAARAKGPISPAVVRRELVLVRQDAPNKRLRRVHPHLLRHTVATRMLAAGVDLVTVQMALGHADIATTAIYLHPTRDMLGDAFDKL